MTHPGFGWRIKILGMSICCLILVAGCVSGNSRSRGRLSDVIEKSSDTHSGNRVVKTTHKKSSWPFPAAYENDGVQNGLEPDNGAGGLPLSDENLFEKVYFGISSGCALVENDDFERMKTIQLVLGFMGEEKSAFEVMAGGSWASIKTVSALDQSIEDGVYIFQMEAAYKHFFHGSQKAEKLSPYFKIGMGWQYMWWDYKNTVYTTDGEKIDFDTLSGFELFTGLGVNIPISHYFKMGLEVLPEATFWGEVTSEGFENDVFSPYFNVRIQAVITYTSKQ